MGKQLSPAGGLPHLPLTPVYTQAVLCWPLLHRDSPPSVPYGPSTVSGEPPVCHREQGTGLGG